MVYQFVRQSRPLNEHYVELFKPGWNKLILRKQMCTAEIMSQLQSANRSQTHVNSMCEMCTIRVSRTVQRDMQKLLDNRHYAKEHLNEFVNDVRNI